MYIYYTTVFLSPSRSQIWIDKGCDDVDIRVICFYHIVVFVWLLADNVWVDSEAADEFWSRWMDWDSKERVRSRDWRIFHPSLTTPL
jgi:hypothetical protein